MLFWFGISLLVAGALCLAIDRRAAHFFHDAIHQRWAAIIHRTTDWAKGSHWLQAAGAAFAGTWLLHRLGVRNAVASNVEHTSLAFIVGLAIASIILHPIKLLLGRRRPRDELELGLYGWLPFRFDSQYDSFPSGHALTIFCVGVIMAGAVPELALLWLIIATYLALTRVFLNSHFLSDVCVGAGLAVIVTRAVVLAWFPDQAQPWF